MTFEWLRGRRVREIGAAVVVVGACLAWRLSAPTPSSEAAPPAPTGRGKPAAPAAELPPGARPIALVNGAEITRDQLAAECLGRHGAGVVETMVNRVIIEQACRRSGVTVTPQDVGSR